MAKLKLINITFLLTKNHMQNVKKDWYHEFLAIFSCDYLLSPRTLKSINCDNNGYRYLIIDIIFKYDSSIESENVESGWYKIVNTLWLRQNGCRFADDVFECIFLNENVWILIKFHWSFFPINNIPALVQVMAWRRSGNKPLSEPVMVRLPMHICITRPQGVNLHCVQIYHIQMTLILL